MVDGYYLCDLGNELTILYWESEINTFDNCDCTKQYKRKSVRVISLIDEYSIGEFSETSNIEYPTETGFYVGLIEYDQIHSVIHYDKKLNIYNAFTPHPFKKNDITVFTEFSKKINLKKISS